MHERTEPRTRHPRNPESWLLGPDAAGRAVIVEGSTITWTGRLPGDAMPPDAPSGTPSLDCDGASILAGEINAHTHLYSALAPLGAVPEPDPPPADFLEILERVWWRLDRALDETSLRASARLYIAEALLAGTTTLIDHHESPNLIEGSLDILADAVRELGCRACLTYGATERNGGRGEARRGLEVCRRLLREGPTDLVVGAVGLHASFTVSDDTIRDAARLCRETGAPLHIHVAEDLADVADARARGDDGPLARLRRLGALPPRSILAHGVHVDPAQMAWPEVARVWWVQNPRSNRVNRVGYASVLGRSRRVALGTDGFPARMEEERDALRRDARQHGEPDSVVEERTRGGYELVREVFGVDVGPNLRPGMAADLRVVTPEGQVRHVMVAGRVVVRDGRLVSGDLDGIREEASGQAVRVRRRVEEEAE